MGQAGASPLCGALAPGATRGLATALSQRHEAASPTNILSFSSLPLFIAFFIWGIGGGTQTFVRPLFAYSLEGSVFLVTLLASSMSLSRLVSGPVTGFVTDRWGRKPLLLIGSGLRGLTSLGNFYSTTYLQFFILEFVGAIGTSMWQTSSSILIADVSTASNRGRAVAIRTTSMRLGTILGPLLAGLVAALFNLRTAFLINFASKATVFFMTIFLIRETRPESAQAGSGGRGRAPAARFDLSILRSRAFLALGLTTLGVSMMFQGVFQTLFPLHAQEQAGMSTVDIGTAISIAGIIALFVSFPNGMVMDRFGRKKSLVAGLFLLAASAYLLAISTDHAGVLRMIIVFGVAQAMSMGASQTFAMDMAPEGRRGSFLGIWTIFNSSGGFIAPLIAGLIVERYGFPAAFLAIAGWLGASALLMVVFAPETGGRRGALPRGAS